MERDEYRRMADHEDGQWWYRSTRALLAQLLTDELVPGALIVDAGCGTGATGGWLAQRGRAVGVDVEPIGLSLLTERHPGVRAVAGDVRALPLRDGAADLVVSVTVLYHEAVADPAAAVRELVRVVRPGGTVCLMEPGVQALRRAHDRVTHAARRFSRRQLGGLLDAAGCDVVRATGAYAFLVPAAAVKSVVERGAVRSDLDGQGARVGDALSRLAAVERRYLRGHDLPAGLSVVAIGRRR